VLVTGFQPRRVCAVNKALEESSAIKDLIVLDPCDEHRDCEGGTRGRPRRAANAEFAAISEGLGPATLHEEVSAACDQFPKSGMELLTIVFRLPSLKKNLRPTVALTLSTLTSILSALPQSAPRPA
jgi:hypothetical protein